MTNPVLLIGGRCNGQRVMADTSSHLPISMQQYSKRGITLNTYPGETEILSDIYHIVHLGYSCFVGIHSTLNIEKALLLLTGRYPKVRKKNPYAIPRKKKTAGAVAFNYLQPISQVAYPMASPSSAINYLSINP